MSGGPRIAVTGVGIVSALALGASATFDRLCAGAVGFRPVTRFDASAFRAPHAAEVDLVVADVAPAGQAASWSRSDAMALVAAREALTMSGAGDAPLALAVGASTAGMREAESVLAELSGRRASQAAARKLLSFPVSATADRLREVLRAVTRGVTLCSACSSGANAAVVGASWLLRGTAERVLVGGTDALCLLTVAGFNALGATDRGPCRPFDAERDGLTLGEGAAFLVLELESTAQARGARVLALLSGWAVGAEAHHITQPEPSGATAARLLGAALGVAGLTPDAVDYLNAHGTGTVHNDAMEARALHAAFGPAVEGVWVSSAKGQVGHTLAAAGALEAALTVLAVAEQRVPPTGGLEVPDPALPALRHVVGRGQRVEVRAALSSSFGFGGTGVVLAFERPDAPPRGGAVPQRRMLVTGAAAWGPAGLRVGEAAADYLGETTPAPGGTLPAAALAALEPERSRRFDEAAAVVTLSAERLITAAGLTPTGVGLAAGTAFGAVERSVRFVERVLERGPRLASPAEFPHLVPSAAAGNASIYLGLSGPVAAVSDLTTSAEAALLVAEELIQLAQADAMIAGSVAPEDALVAEVLGPIAAAHWDPRPGAGAGWVLLEAEDVARRRGAPALALLVHLGVGPSPEELVAGLPPPGPGALVVHTGDAAAVGRELGGSAWGSVPRCSPEPLTGWHDALGGVAIAAAVAAVARGQAPSALVWTRRAHQAFGIVFHRPGG